jgi:hypothetical protein
MNDAVQVDPVPLRELLRWVPLGGLLMLLAYLVAFDQGAVSQAGTLLHEVMHDGRHLLAVPCH